MIALYIVIGIVCFVAFFMIFGDKIETQWEYEAEFHDQTGREYGEFEIELSKNSNLDKDFVITVKLVIRQDILLPGSQIRAQINDHVILEGQVEKPGYFRFYKKFPKDQFKKPEVGQVCTVFCNDMSIADAPLQLD